MMVFCYSVASMYVILTHSLRQKERNCTYFFGKGKQRSAIAYCHPIKSW